MRRLFYTLAGSLALRGLLPLVIWTWAALVALAAPPRTENVVLLTSDGLRWQELFTGADARLIDEEIGGVKKPDDVRARYWHESPERRRERLMPFFWSVVAREGQVFGAPEADSLAIVTNGRYFSYPGYQEILCGFPDDAVDSNDKRNNKNVSVLEWLHRTPKHKGRIAAFTSWDVFPYILNVERSDLPVNSGWQPLEEAADKEALALANRLMLDLPHSSPDCRLDGLTAFGAMQYLALHEPNVLYISFDETDAWCHAGRYDLYLDAARNFDRYLRELWEWLQKSEKYAGKTSLVITTDHGRGDGREEWKSHNEKYPGSERIWMAVMGPDTPPEGLRRNVEVKQAQVAATVAALLGEDFAASDSRISPPLPGITRAETAAGGQ